MGIKISSETQKRKYSGQMQNSFIRGRKKNENEINIEQLYELLEIWRKQLINVIMTFNNESPPQNDKNYLKKIKSTT